MTEPQTKVCQNCHSSFVVEPDDFAFYERIQVPPPTRCPECRFVSRTVWRNEFILNRRTDDYDGKKIFSVYSDESPVKVYEKSFWWSDGWDAQEYARDYDWSRPFFAQVGDLLREVPLPSGAVIEGVNSEYSLNFTRPKNCYLSFAGSYSEDCAYVIWSRYAKNSFDSHMLYDSELCYGDLNVEKSYQTHFSVNCESCQNLTLCKNCIGCTDCFGCANLRNKSHCIFNKQYTKESYTAEIKKLNLGSYASLARVREEVHRFWLSHPVKYVTGRNNVNATGEYINNSKNSLHCYRVREAENVKYSQNIMTATAKDCYDYTNWGEGTELMYYDLQCGENSYDVQFSISSFPANKSIRYCIFCANSSDLFGCVGMKKKQYCILNKQYTKEEYEALVPEIIQHMKDAPFQDTLGRTYSFGDFFPPVFTSFAYNETVAHEFFPLTKEQALAQGYRWKDTDTKEYTITVTPDKLPDHIADVDDSILKETIGCAHEGKCNEQCATAFRIIPEELAFCRRMNIPLPRLCPNCRHYERLKQRNSIHLWHRRCQCAGAESENGIYTNGATHFHGAGKCPNGFETSYAPDRKEIVYCEQCYQAEVV